MNRVSRRKVQESQRAVLKIALRYFLPFFLLVGFTLYQFQTQRTEEERVLRKIEEGLHMDLMMGEVSQILREIAVDLKILSAHHEVETALAANKDALLDPLTQEFVTFSEIKGFYDQIRLIDLDGMERIRVNYINGQSVVTPRRELQKKSHRTYFKEILSLEEGVFYLSRFDLNIEKGQVERPLKPILRVGLSILGPPGQAGGILILNYLGRHFFDHLTGSGAKGPDAYLILESDDLWLQNIRGEVRWRFGFRDRSDPTFKERFPELWENIAEIASGQFFSPEGLVTHRTIHPSLEASKGITEPFPSLQREKRPSGIKPFSWKLVSIVPNALVYTNSEKTFKTSLAIFALTSIFLGITSFVIAQSKVKRDISDQLRAQGEKDRKFLVEELEEKNAELERFTYTVSHDLKSPLITIKGFLGLLEKDIALGEERLIKSDINRISNAAEKMKVLLEELLELSRVGRSINPPEEVPLLSLVREAVEMVKGSLNGRNVKLEIGDNLPTIYADVSRIPQVFENLLDNAVKFMGSQAHPTIVISARQDQEETIVFIRDNGTGIDPRYHETVFGLFNRLDQNIEGTGVGLAVVKRIIEVHHGRIWVESEGIGTGSTFCFSLPVHPEKES